MSESTLDLFEKYLQNQLSEGEAKAFEAQLAADPVFKSEFENFKVLQAGIRMQALKDKLQMLKSHTNNNGNPKPIKPKSHLFRNILILLTLGLSAIIIYLWMANRPDNKQISPSPAAIDSLQNSATPSTKLDSTLWQPKENEVSKKDTYQLTKPVSTKKKDLEYANNEGKSKQNFVKEVFNLYSNPSSFAVILRDSPQDVDQKFNLALTSFQNQKYQASIDAIQGLNGEKYDYLRAHAFFHLSKFGTAADIFRKFVSDDFSVYYEESKFYLALSLVADHAKDKDELTKLITELEKSSQYQVQAKKMKELLGK